MSTLNTRHKAVVGSEIRDGVAVAVREGYNTATIILVAVEGGGLGLRTPEMTK